MSPDDSENIGEEDSKNDSLFNANNVMFRMGATSEIKSLKDR